MPAVLNLIFRTWECLTTRREVTFTSIDISFSVSHLFIWNFLFPFFTFLLSSSQLTYPAWLRVSALGNSRWALEVQEPHPLRIPAQNARNAFLPWRWEGVWEDWCESVCVCVCVCGFPGGSHPQSPWRWRAAMSCQFGSPGVRAASAGALW